MRILVVSQYFWPETFRTNEVVQSLRELDHHVEVLSGQPNYPDGVIQPGYSAASLFTEVHDGLTIHRVPLIEARQAGLPVLASELDYVRDVLDPEQTFDPESAVSIARAVKRFLGLQEEPLPLQDAARFIEHLLEGEK